MNKFWKIILAILSIVSLNIGLVVNCVHAVDNKSQYLYEVKDLDKIIKYNNKLVTTTYVAYSDGANVFPAYCLNVNLPGVGENGAYSVSCNEKITDVGLWRVIVNGYPYKKLNYLHVQDEQEAYIATKQAIYCYLYQRDPNTYSGVGEAGERTINALKQILNDAYNSTEIPENNFVDIITNDEKWQIDDINSKCISKTYEINAKTKIADYIVNLEGENILEGTIITDVNNIPKKQFKEGEKFKILIPLYELNTSGTFKINVQTQMITKPVIYGKAPNSGLQDYALTTYTFEEAKGYKYEDFGENKTKIQIIKKDNNTKELLQGVEFEILDENKEVKYSNLITDINGQVEISGLIPGQYFVREIKPLEGYIIYDDLIEINIELNEKLVVTINNSKEHKIEVENNIKEIEVSRQVKKLPKTGM